MFRDLNDKIEGIRCSFAPLMQRPLAWIETAELQHDDGTWDSWHDLPVRLFVDRDVLVSIAWNGFDDLWLATDLSLPFSLEDANVRWKANALSSWKDALGLPIHSVLLGRGEMSIEGRDIEIWTRLLIQIGDRLIEIFNALDENGYGFHSKLPRGEFIRCL